ncbi:hypothetical protein HP548_00620 [Paenibacillus taichungensis]|uniref:Uncharacterized protein n=1 Tax=Paenibacillus taichungensis TaxID=484184 RepID=A0ABX2MDZ5_9BACL|nr:hypothetical protein [Paenibacillus taichungensis]NUU52614.1 hypothetical protein [Paenibacillus taichungensis]
MLEQYDKESVYDERISPLMKEIIQICKDEGIPMVTSFYLTSAQSHPNGKELFCTTTLPVEGNTPDFITDVIGMFSIRHTDI